MTSDSNPFGTGTPGYGSANITFGDAAANGQAPAAGRDLIKDTTTADFGKDVIEESRNQPVLVDFWAPWCGPCRQLAPALEKAVNARGGAVKLVKLNIDDHPAIPGQMGIQSIPAVIAFKDGQPVDGFMGALPESQIVQFLDKLGASSPQADAVEQALEMAKEQLEAGAAEEAAQIYAQIMSMEPETHLAIAGLAGGVVDGPVTDLSEFHATGFPMWASGVSPITTKQLGLYGALNVPVSVGGQIVRPGDLILADDSGVVALDRAQAQALAAKCIGMQDFEIEVLEKLRTGVKLGTISGASEKIAKAMGVA